MKEAVNPEKTGTKAAAHYHVNIAGGESHTIRLRLSDVAPFALKRAYPGGDPFGEHFERIFKQRWMKRMNSMLRSPRTTWMKTTVG